MAQAMAETVAYVNRARAFMPPGTVPPFVMRFDAGSVPVGYLAFSSETRSVGQIQDLALNTVRPLFATLPGVSAPPPFGGSAAHHRRHVDPAKLQAYGLSAQDVVAAIAGAETISPSGNITLAGTYPMVPVNSIVKTPGPGRGPAPHRRPPDGLRARRRQGGGRLGHRHQLRARRRPAARSTSR